MASLHEEEEVDKKCQWVWNYYFRQPTALHSVLEIVAEGITDFCTENPQH